MRVPVLAPELTLRPDGTSTVVAIPVAMAAAAAWRAPMPLAPPCGTRVEKRRPGSPSAATYCSAGVLVMPIGMTPSTSRGLRPASAIAVREASTWSSSAVRGEALEY